MKKITKILFALILCLTLLNVNAKSVKINGDNDDIYESGGSGSAKFNKATNTLTLNDYTGGCIYFDGFDNETISIVVTGDSIISSPTYNEAYAAIGLETSDDNTHIEIISDGTHSLEFTNYKYGIFVNDSDITIKDIILGIHDISYVGIYSVSGDVYIKDSTIDSYKTEVFGEEEDLYVISCDEGNAYLDNVSYTSLNSYTDTYAGDTLTIKDSDLHIKNTGYFAFYAGEIIANNSTFDSKDSEILFQSYARELYLEKCTLNFKDSVGVGSSGDEIIYKNTHINGNVVGISDFSYTTSIINSTIDLKIDGDLGIFSIITEVKDSTIKMDGCDTAFRGLGVIFNNSNVTVTNSGTADKPGLVAGEGLEIYDSTVKCVSNGFCVLLNTLIIDNSDVSFESGNSMPAIVVAPNLDGDTTEYEFDDVIQISNTTLREKNLIKDYTYLDSSEMDYEGYAYSFAQEELADNYDDSTLTDLFENVASTIHFDTTKNPKTGDSLSYYITLSILSIMTITSCYYVLRKEY